ncbi:2-oxo acid dehydrogenase subunit E2 [Spirochaetia bacterium 38H-sp]|uniref:2-oxo acid dehydrogenase subunit E2 n=1 Tax=Rarispira pelagica TaxID=3141764 RepID=A0ABU9UBH0_9SPIR
MGIRHRWDGILIKDLPGFRKINPYVMKGRNESAVYYPDEIELDKTLAYIRDYNRRRKPGQKVISLFHVILAAAVRTIAFRPQANRFVSGRLIYQRRAIEISFVVKKDLTEEGQESTTKIAFSPFDTIADVAEKLHASVKAARDKSGNDTDKEMDLVTSFPRFIVNTIVRVFRFLDYFGIAPKSMIETDPLYTSLFLANLSSLGLDAPFHHLYEWGTASVFFVMGKMKKKKVTAEDGNVVEKTIMEAKFTVDDRVSEGIYWANTINMFKDFLSDPSALEEKPDIPEEILKEHMYDKWPKEKK